MLYHMVYNMLHKILHDQFMNIITKFIGQYKFKNKINVIHINSIHNRKLRSVPKTRTNSTCL